MRRNHRRRRRKNNGIRFVPTCFAHRLFGYVLFNLGNLFRDCIFEKERYQVRGKEVRNLYVLLFICRLAPRLAYLHHPAFWLRLGFFRSIVFQTRRLTIDKTIELWYTKHSSNADGSVRHRRKEGDNAHRSKRSKQEEISRETGFIFTKSKRLYVLWKINFARKSKIIRT